MVIQTRIRGDRETEGGLAGWGLENDIDFFFYLLHMGRSRWLVVVLEGLRINKEALVSIFLKRRKEVDYKVVERIRTWYIRLPVFLVRGLSL